MRRDEGIGVNADEQVGLHASRLLHPRVQWHKIIGIAREEGAHRIVADAAAVDAFGQQTGNPQYHVFFSCAAGAYGTGILAAMAGIKCHDDQPVGLARQLQGWGFGLHGRRNRRAGRTFGSPGVAQGNQGSERVVILGGGWR